MKYLIIILLLTSCDQLHHYNKFIEKGGKLEQVETPVMVPYLLKGVNGEDSIAYREINIPCPDPVIETRWETKWKYRFDNRRFRDSVNHIRKSIEDSLDHIETVKSDSIDGAVKNAKTAAKVTKNESNNKTKQVKYKYNIWIILISLAVGYVLPKIAQRAWRKLK